MLVLKHWEGPKKALDEAAKYLCLTFYENQGQKLLPNLKKIVAESAGYELANKTIKRVAKLKKIIPKGAEITVEMLHSYIGIPFDDIISMFQCVKVNSMMTNLEEHLQQHNISNKLFTEASLPLQGLEFLWYNNEPRFDFLNEFLNKHSNITEAKVVCKYVPIPFPFTQITTLDLWTQGQEPLRSFKTLEPLVNLKSLKISFYESGAPCVIGHETVNLPKLQEFSMLKVSIHCQGCMTALANSFPHLSEFHGSINVQEYPSIMEMLFKNWRYLKEMRLNCGPNLESLGKLLENNDYTYEHWKSPLVVLQIKQAMTF